MGTGSFPGVKSGLGVTVTPHPLLVRGQEMVELYLYSSYGPYGLYRASVPVQGCTLPFFYNHYKRKRQPDIQLEAGSSGRRGSSE